MATPITTHDVEHLFTVLPAELRLRVYGHLLPPESLLYEARSITVRKQNRFVINSVSSAQTPPTDAHKKTYCNLRLVSRTVQREIDPFFWERTTLQLAVLSEKIYYPRPYLVTDLSKIIPFQHVQKLEINFSLHDAAHSRYYIYSQDWLAEHRGTIRVHLDRDQEKKTFTANAIPQQLARRERGHGMEMYALRRAEADVRALVTDVTREEGLDRDLVEEIVDEVAQWRWFDLRTWESMRADHVH